MTVLLLRLAGPLQSWGDSSRFTVRSTRHEPTKSGVLGLLAAAQGRRRTDSIEDLLQLRFGVRADQPGTVVRDFHTAHDQAGASMPLSHRYYLSDAVFVAGIEGEQALLEALLAAVERPEFPLYLGRRACPVEGKLALGLREGGLDDALSTEPWQAAPWHRKRMPTVVTLDVHTDSAPEAPGEDVRDVPLSFDPSRREYGWRTVASSAIQLRNDVGTDEPDWLAALGDG
ncbi:type I-E CRISPR-associated protein Cas5/CasD [Tessaracoccus aquimaris]|uniref:Type I-E CRISPR-associated protein Cas5/CasD n=1 Tax=Tessaracoccus aquimaris TaxID=1332264 RepID=A0A1Q2CR42_9ACTN|nr:type I-E CRISPR-associated protein Cas5/CasD [Tessaracoccus aquimaris]AQP48574.1 type I-E CRISPR-associated protein Cas5/CasD [Tessaracoccus aquimaris]